MSAELPGPLSSDSLEAAGLAPKSRHGSTPGARAKRKAKAAIRRATLTRGYEELVGTVDHLGARIDALAGAVDRLDERVTRQSDVNDSVRVNEINIQLLKGEVRNNERLLRELGFAFAPATGIEGAGARFSELREAVNGLERQLRNLAVTSAHDHGPETAAAPEVPAAPPTSTLFNYVGFERRFRGDPEVILDTLEERYADLLLQNQPVVDVGCGRGELLDRLASRGAEVIGVEPDPGMVADARARGLTVHQAYAADYLRSVPDHSLGAIISTHVVEHLELDILIELLELSREKLKPGGVFVAETPNPASLIVLGNSYIMDPTHVWPLHPSLLAFLAETAGYRDVRLNFYSPAEGYHLKPVDLPEGASEADTAVAASFNAAVEQLNDVLFGPQDYSITATTAP